MSREKPQTLDTKPKSQDANQALLQEKPFEILTDPDQRREMRERAREVVRHIQEKGYSNLVFLDKSARPIQTLLRTVWKQKYPKTPFPKVNFVNIGRETSGRFEQIIKDEKKITDFWERGKYLDEATPESIAELVGPEEIERIKKEYSYLADAPDGAKILVIDEYSATGRSLGLAKKILETVFPQKDSPNTPRLDVDTLAFAEADGTLFRGKAGNYMPPWSFGDLNPKYGTSGVVDPSEHRFTAEASHKMTTEMRVAVIDGEERLYKEQLQQALKSVKENDPLKKITEVYAKSHSLDSIDGDKYRHIQELLDTIAVNNRPIAEQLGALFVSLFQEKILPAILEEEAVAQELQKGLTDGDADTLGTKIPDELLNKLLEAYKRHTTARQNLSRSGSAPFELARGLVVWNEKGDIIDESSYELGKKAVSEFLHLLWETVPHEVMTVFETIQTSRYAIEELGETRKKIIEEGDSGRQNRIRQLRDEIKKVAGGKAPRS